MLNNDAFSRAAALLEEMTKLTGPQARGVVHLAVKESGFDAHQVSPMQMTTVLRRVLPKKLEAQGVAANECKSICEDIARKIEAATWDRIPEAAAAMFDRLDQRTQR